MKVLFASLLVLALSACQGQNPFKPQANPTQNYGSVNAAATQGFTGEKAPQLKPTDDDGSDLCLHAFDITVDGDQGGKLMTFSQGVAKTYTLHVTSNLGRNIKISRVSGPDDVMLAVPNAKDPFTLTLSRTPPVYANQDTLIETLVVHFESEKFANCPSLNLPLNLITLKAGKAPVVADALVSIADLPVAKITYGQAITFHVDVTDAATVAPQLKDPVFAGGTDKTILDITKAIDCDKKTAPTHKGNVWEFTCKLTTQALLQAPINSGKTLTATFTESAVGVSGKASIATPAKLQIEFPVVPAAKAAPAKQGAKV